MSASAPAAMTEEQRRRALNVRVHSEIFNQRILSVEDMREAWRVWRGGVVTELHDARTQDGHWFHVVPHDILGGDPEYVQDIPNYAVDIWQAEKVEAEIARRGLGAQYVGALDSIVGTIHSLPDLWAFELIRATPEQKCRAALSCLPAAPTNPKDGEP